MNVFNGNLYLSWVGLEETKAWNKMYKDDAYTKKEQKRIIKTIKKFNKSGKNGCK